MLLNSKLEIVMRALYLIILSKKNKLIAFTEIKMNTMILVEVKLNIIQYTYLCFIFYQSLNFSLLSL